MLKIYYERKKAMEIKIIIGKEEIKFDDFPSEQRPRIVNDRILVPIYLIAQKIGLGYSWNGQNSICGNLILTVKKEEIREEIKIPVGKTYFDCIIHHTDGTSDYISYEHTDKIEPKIIGGRLMVPVRGVFRSMCYGVGWDAANRKVLLFPPSDNKYIVRYNYNFIYEDTDDTPYFHSALKGNSVTLPSPTREGYLFEGWFIGKVDGTKVGGGGGTYRPTDSVMLYAHWTDKYTITYKANGGEINATSDKVKIGESISLRTPTRTGFTFEGWYTNEDLTGNPVGSSYTPSSNVTLYAKWKSNFPRIRYGSTDDSNYENVDCGSEEGHTLGKLILRQLDDKNGVTLAYAGKSVEFVLKQNVSCVLFSYAMVLYALQAKVTKYDYRTDTVHEMDADPYTCFMANIAAQGDWSEAKNGYVTIRAGYFYSEKTCDKSPVNVVYDNLLNTFGGRRRVVTQLQNIDSSLEAAKSNAKIVTEALNAHREGVIVRTGDNSHSFVVVDSSYSSSENYTSIEDIGSCFTVYDSADTKGDGINFNSSWSGKKCDFSRLIRFEVIE